MPLSTTELNRIANEISASAMTCYAHTGAPGTAGTANRVTGVSAVALPAGDWSAASAGDVQYDADVEFGVLHRD